VGSPLGDWLILELIEQSEDPSGWQASDYQRAVDQLCKLHDRFWALDVDLSTFPWLSHPLSTDFDVHVTAAKQGLSRIQESGQPQAIAEHPERMELLELLIASASEIVAPLQAQTHTLLHGDYWPGNIAALPGGKQVVYDWQLAGVGPGIMDLLAFVYKSLWWFEDLPITTDELVGRYRKNIVEATGTDWDQAAWSLLWDHALLWRFIQEWVDLLAVIPGPLIETWFARLESVWLDPVRQAAERRLG
jgi:thiamine kinase-like enzyme